MAGSDSSVHGGRYEDEEPPVARAELHQRQNSLLQAMERMFNERLPAAGGRIPRNQYEESGGENSGYGDDHFRDGCDCRGGGRRGGHDDRCARGDHERGRHVHFDDEDEFQENSDEESDFNPFANQGRFGHDHDHRRDGGDDGEHHRGRHRNDPNNIAHVKLSIPKKLGKEDADAYLEWEEQCDQIFRVHNLSDQKCVNLASVEFSGYALTWWNQLQRNQLDLGCNHIDTWAEMKRVMRRRFVPSSHQRDLRNRLQILKQGSKSVDDYFKEMKLLLIRSGIREDEESKMARFLHGLNTEISDFVEMFPYHNLQDLVDQAMRTERKIQLEGRVSPMGINLFQLHGAGSILVPLLVVVDLKVLPLGLLHPLVLQRQWPLLLLHQQFSERIDVLLQVQQFLRLHLPLHHLHIAEALCVTSAKVEDMLLLNALVGGP
jgi:hypothetical protein